MPRPTRRGAAPGRRPAGRRARRGIRPAREAGVPLMPRGSGLIGAGHGPRGRRRVRRPGRARSPGPLGPGRGRSPPFHFRPPPGRAGAFRATGRTSHRMIGTGTIHPMSSGPSPEGRRITEPCRTGNASATRADARVAPRDPPGDLPLPTGPPQPVVRDAPLATRHVVAACRRTRRARRNCIPRRWASPLRDQVDRRARCKPHHHVHHQPDAQEVGEAIVARGVD